MVVETFIIPIANQKSIIYKPLKKLVCLADQPFVDNLQKRLSETDEALDVRQLQQPEHKLENNGELTLFLTSDCNLRCKYCFAEGGETIKYMSWDIAKSAIDFAFNKESMHLNFHGGGEPTLAFNLIQKAIDYVRKDLVPKETYFTMQTNGLFPGDYFDYFKDVGIRLGFSFEGTPEVQTMQRSSELETELIIQNLLSAKQLGLLNFIRAVVTEHSVNKMSDTIEFLHRNDLRGIMFGASRYTGRARLTETMPPDSKHFINEFIKAYERAERYNIHCGLANVEGMNALHSFACGACGTNIFVTPDGDLSSCLEITSLDAPAAKKFIYGYFNHKTKTFVIDSEKRKELLERSVDSIEECKPCFMKRHCAGGCPAEVYLTKGTLNAPDTNQCEITQSIGIYLLGRKLGLTKDQIFAK